MFTHTSRKTARIMLLLLTALCLTLLCGCASQRHYANVEKKAVRYYREKYGLNGVTVEDSYVAGNYGLFGYLGVKDRAYEMSDGSTVYLDDDTELPYFRLKLSERVLNELDERGCIDVYFLDLREGGQPLMMYYGPESNSTFSVYTVFRDQKEIGVYGSLNPDYLYYFGTYHLEE